ncbi:MAG TPA: helix-turn-helix transcriptional regulator [Streptosporangiales bacterium]
MARTLTSRTARDDGTVRRLRVAPDAPPAPREPESPDADLVRRRELGAFLRSRRERISPQEVGLPNGGRRRTPGLRREEVAQLAGVGVTWYTWLEQARDINVSQQVLDAIARTLMLDPNERAHLFTLAGAPGLHTDDDSPGMPPTVQAILDQLDPFPACVQNARYDLLAYNRTYNQLFMDLDELPREERNCLWLLFTHPHWREAVLDWDYAASRMVAQYRAAMASHMGEPAWKCMVKRLQNASPEFAQLWERHDVAAPGSTVKRFFHPEAGLVMVRHTYMWLGPHNGTRVTAYVPVDEQAAERLRALHTRALASA